MQLLIILFASLLLASACLAQGETTYFGKTGSKNAVFVLSWPSGGRKVSGYYYTTERPGRRYTLAGENYRDGRLELTEYTCGEETAAIRLKKSARRGQIRWSGTMYNTDGRQIPVRMARDRAAW
ncbi:MAG TPA: hypothetical protein VK689_14370 [Armatimonadota bacterium]|nr:hypothetical protein [Armatimonadota bacterium]